MDRGPASRSPDERLKRPFTRSDTPQRGGGRWPRLAIVERVARAHGGTLELLPRDGGGLTARLSLQIS